MEFPDGSEPVYVAEPPASPVEPSPEAVRAPKPGRRWWYAGAAVVVAGGVAAGILLTSSDQNPFGERTARLAAERFVAALNAGDKDGAARISCANFADAARSVAEAGKDPGIDFVLNAVRVPRPDSGTAQITQRLRFTGTTQQIPHVVRLDRSDGLWRVCGEV